MNDVEKFEGTRITCPSCSGAGMVEFLPEQSRSLAWQECSLCSGVGTVANWTTEFRGPIGDALEGF